MTVASRDRAPPIRAQRLFTHLLPPSVATHINPRLGHYLVVLLSLCTLLAAVMGTVYSQEVTTAGDAEGLRASFIKVFCILLLAAAVCSWWVVLASESRRRAQEESDRQNRLLEDEIEAHGRTDAALQAAKDLADAANQAKTRYVAGITHELRTPLNSILGYAQILLRLDALQGEPRRAVTTIQRSGEHLHELINGLLDLARIEAGRLRLDPAPLPMRELLDDLVHMVEPQAAAKGLTFTLETAGRVPGYVRADAKRLRQILLNLLGNAVRFTDSGHITLRLDHSREVARLQVIDTGIGIAQADLERIFMPFERGAAGRRSGDAGTGLGLTITHLLTQLMGGELSVESTPGIGSTFTVRLYLSEVTAPGPRGVTLHRPVSGYIGARRHLLVVDDHPTQRQMLAGMLLPLGFVVREAASGSECIDSVLHEPPDAVLLDVTMDDMDGWETARLIRARGITAMPIIMVSANAFENRPDRLAQSGAQAFVDKPVIESELLVALQRHLELEWVADLPQAAWTPPLVIEPSRLPAQAVSQLMQLARLGHSKGLYESLDRLQHMQPASLARIAAWRRLVEHGGFDELIDELRPMLELDDAEAA